MRSETLASPLVTVLIPAYNAERTLGRAIRSVVSQGYPCLELLVVNDGSTDETLRIAQGFEADGVQVLDLPRNLGVSAASNAGIRLARGEFIAFLDADDEWLPGKLQAQVSLLQSDPRMTFAFCGATVHRLDGQVVARFGMDLGAVAPGEIWHHLLEHVVVAKPTVVARASALMAVSGFDETLPIAEDQDLWIRLALAGTVGRVPKELVRIHLTQGSLTGRYRTMQADITLGMIRRHLDRLEPVLGRQEAKRIWRRRVAAQGHIMYSSNQVYGRGARLLAQAVLLGEQPLANVMLLIRASPPARALKTWLRGY